MHHWLLFQKYTSIKHIVYIHLRNFLSVYTKDEEILWVKKGRLPLYQDTDNGKILYISSVAFQLSGSDSSNSTQFVRDIVTSFSAHCSEVFSVKVVPPAWIHVELTDPTLAAWLHFLINEGLGLQETGNWELKAGVNQDKLSSKLFTIQYAHARCCSLVRLADREGLIKLRSASEDDCLTPEDSIPWLDGDQKLRFAHPDEMGLLHLLVKTVDDLVFPDSNRSVNWITTGLKLSEAFDRFWCNCRIWGEVKINSLELSQARLGLLIATRLVLKSILEAKLRANAPLEL